MRNILFLLLFVSTVVSAQIGRYPFSVARTASSSYPAIIDQADVWLSSDSTDLITIVDDSITTWVDINNDYSFSQATGSRQPILTGGVVYFDGVDDGLTCTTYTPNDTATIFILASQHAYSSQSRILYCSTSWNIVQGSTGSGYVRLDALTNIEQSGYSYDTWYVITSRIVSEGTSGIQRDGGEETTDAAGTVAVAANMGVDGYTAPCELSVREIIIFNSNLGSSDRSDIITYLTNKKPT
jgi:hypothetical protein